MLCVLCLEDVRASDMVWQLPACRRLFHVDHIDACLRLNRLRQTQFTNIPSIIKKAII